MIALIDYGSGNLRSVEKAFRFLGADIKLTSSPEDIYDAKAVVLPGVGAFSDCLTAMDRQGIVEPVLKSIKAGKAFLGICVGYQALFESSQEFNSTTAGLSVFKGIVRRFTSRPEIKIPQIGWNQIMIQNQKCPLYKDVPEGSFVYFVHSYYPVPEDSGIIATTTQHGDVYSSSVWKDNVYGVQFHPEKSQKVGLKILENFLKVID